MNSPIALQTMETRTLQVVLLIIMTISTVLSKERCDPRDKRVLLQIKKEFNSPSLTKAWDSLKDCCNWDHVGCNLKDNRVTLLYSFDDSTLKLPRPTPIPPSIGNLPYLSQIHFQNNANLTGPIPPSLVHLKRLDGVSLKGINASGPIPEFLSQLKTLTYLDLSESHFSGPIPASLSRLKNLQTLALDGNRLSGPIPQSFANFSSLTRLYLNRNQLSGRIPASFAKLNFIYLGLSWNRLQGDASMLFGSNKQTNYLILSGNKFAFDLGKVHLPKELWSFLIDHNRIYGTLPQDLSQLSILKELDVSHNYLCGKIPQGAILKQFNSSSYAHNKCLCGPPLPPCRH